MPEKKSLLQMHPKVASLASSALGFFQKGDILSGTARLGKAYALSKKVPSPASPILPLVAYLGLLNDGEEAGGSPPDPATTSKLVGRHTGICGVIETWTFERSLGKASITPEYHAAASRFCLEGSLSEEMRGKKDEIGIPAQILNEFGVDVSTPQKTMDAIQTYLSAVGEMAPEASLESSPDQALVQKDRDQIRPRRSFDNSPASSSSAPNATPAGERL
jgi:hypothetical protein